MILAVYFEFHLLEIEHDVGDVLNDAWQRSKLVLRAGDFCRCDGCAFQRGKQHTAERVPDRVTITGFKWLGSKTGVRICGCALVFSESFRHFKTTVTNWHNQFSNVDFRSAIEALERLNNRNSKTLSRNSFC